MMSDVDEKFGFLKGFECELLSHGDNDFVG